MIPTFILGPVIIGASSNITSLGSIVRVAIRPRPAFFVITKSIGASPVVKDCFSVLQSSLVMLMIITKMMYEYGIYIFPQIEGNQLLYPIPI